MAIWPFRRNNARDAVNMDEPDVTAPDDVTTGQVHQAVGEDSPAVAPAAQSAEQPQVVIVKEHDPVGGNTGPFDGDHVEIENFDFSDFSNGILNLGSLQLPLPKTSQVQVEMGDTGPKMLHVVTTFGRITPVAFAAPSKTSQWEESVPQLQEQMTADGLTVTLEDGPWGAEIVGTGANDLAVRMIGAEGPRWLVRFTLIGPSDRSDDLKQLAYELMARTFVYRGSEPILAGNSLPIALPPALIAQMQQAMQVNVEQLEKSIAEAENKDT